MKFYIEITNPLGKYDCAILEGSLNDIMEFKNNMSHIYDMSVYEDELQDGNYIMFSKDIINSSIFKIVIINN